jgi:hypothetical protein
VVVINISKGKVGNVGVMKKIINPIPMNKENIIINIDNNARHAEAKANTYSLRNEIILTGDYYYAYVNGYLEENDIGGEGERI